MRIISCFVNYSFWIGEVVAMLLSPCEGVESTAVWGVADGAGTIPLSPCGGGKIGRCTVG
jgi:hypothetical protein